MTKNDKIKVVEFTEDEIALMLDDYETLMSISRYYRRTKGLDENKLTIVDKSRLEIMKKLKGGE